MNPQRIGVANALWNNCISFPLRGIGRCCQTGITICANRMRAKCPIIDKGLDVAANIVTQASACCSPVIGRMTQLRAIGYDVFWGQDGKNKQNISVLLHALLISTVAALLFQQYGSISIEAATGETSLSDYVEMDVEYLFRVAISLLMGITSCLYLKKHGVGEEEEMVISGLWGLGRGVLFGLIRLGVMKSDDDTVVDDNKKLALILSTYASLGYLNQFIGCSNKFNTVWQNNIFITELMMLAFESNHNGVRGGLLFLAGLNFSCSDYCRLTRFKEFSLPAVKGVVGCAVKGFMGSLILGVGESFTTHNAVERDLNYTAAIRGSFFGLVGALVVLLRK